MLAKICFFLLFVVVLFNSGLSVETTHGTDLSSTSSHGGSSSTSHGTTTTKGHENNATATTRPITTQLLTTTYFYATNYSQSSGFIDNTCEKGQEPSGYCSLLLQTEMTVSNPIVLKYALFSIFKESWMIIAELASYWSSSVGLYVEYLEYLPMPQNRRRLLAMNGGGKGEGNSGSGGSGGGSEGGSGGGSGGESSSFTTTASSGSGGDSGEGSSVSTTQSSSGEGSSVSTTRSSGSGGSSEGEGSSVATTGSSGSGGEGSSFTTTGSSGHGGEGDDHFTTTSTSSSSSSYYYNFSVAFFDGSDCDVWYTFFAEYGSSFINDFAEYLVETSSNFTSDSTGFGSISSISVTLSERNSNGAVIKSTTFTSTTSSANNYNGKHIMFVLGSLIIAYFSWLL